MGDLEARLERLGRAAHAAARTCPGPRARSPSCGGLCITTFLPAACLAAQAQVLDDVLGRLRDHAAAVVEALAPGAPGDLLEVAHAEDAGLLAVELAELGEQHRADRDVDADAQRVGAADHLEQPLLRQLLDQQPVLGQQARVVDADAVAQEALEVLAVGRVERRRPSSAARDRLLVLLRRDVDAHQVLGLLGRAALREVDQVDGRAPAWRPGPSIVSCSGVSRYSKSSGTGRSAPAHDRRPRVRSSPSAPR